VIDEAKREILRLHRHCRRVEAQRDELLTALSRIAIRIDNTSGSPTFSATEHDSVMDLISKVHRALEEPA
jgi:hypothetical protein